MHDIAIGVFFPAATFVVARPETPEPLSVAVAVTCAGTGEAACGIDDGRLAALDGDRLGTPAAPGFFLSSAKWMTPLELMS